MNCYAVGSVENDAMFGALGNYAGLVARNLGGSIDTCYAACAVPLWYGEGLVGVNEGDMKGCLWDVEASGITYSTGGTGLSTQEMMSTQVLTDLGWGGTPCWVFEDGRDYPRLTWERTSDNSAPGSDR